MAEIKKLIDDYGGVVKFCEKTGLHYTTVYKWHKEQSQITEAWYILLKYALEHGFDRKLKMNSNKKVFIDQNQ